MNIIFTILFLFISGTVYAQECTQPSCFQQKDKELTGLANTTSAADRVPWYIDADGNMDLAPFTAYGRSVVGAPDAAAARALLGVTVGGSAHEIEDEGNSVIQRSIMNFTGAGVTATDSGGKTTIDIPGIGGHVIKNEGSALTTQPNLNFVGSGIDCINDAGNSETECTVAAGAESDPVVGAVSGVVKSDGAGNFSAAVIGDLGGQPLDADLTAIAGLAGTTGIAQKTAANTWALANPTASPCGVNAAPRGLNADLTPFGCTAYQPLDADLTTYAGITPSANTQTLLAGADYAAWRTNLSLVPGTNVQTQSTRLTEIAAIGLVNGQLYGTSGAASIPYTLHDCPSGRLSFDLTNHDFPCNSSSGSIGGTVTSGPFTVGSGTDTVTNSQWVQEGVSGIAVTGQSTFGTVGTNDLTFDVSGVTGHKTATYPNASGTFVYKDTNDDLTNKTISYSSNAITIPDIKWFDAAACQDTTASHVWDYLAAEVPAVACDTGTNTQKAYLAFDDATDEAIQFKFRLGAGFQSINWTFRWKGVATAGAVGWCVQLVRVPDGATSDPAFPAQGAGNCVSDTAKGTTLQENEATITSVTCTSCAAGDLVYGRLSRDANGGAVTDSFSGDAFLLGWERTIIYTH